MVEFWCRRFFPRLAHAWALGVLAFGCRPPIVCPPLHEARHETLCPPCETLANPPPGYCPCSRTWVCRADPVMNEWVARERARAALARAVASPSVTGQPPPVASNASTPPLAEPARPHVPRVRELTGCAVSCPNGGAREVAMSCFEGGARRSEIVARCDGSEDATEFRCAEPWRVVEYRCRPVVRPEPPRGRCAAGPGRCCMPDGRIVTPCGGGPAPSPSERRCVPALCGSGGFCDPCR
jgi:hypothetical protein